jgi:hypothetical protein
MRAFRPVLTSRARFTYIRFVRKSSSVNGARMVLPQMAPSRNYSSAIERVPATPWSKSVSRNHAEIASMSAEGQPKRRVYIALGSNLGDRIGMIEKACNEMSARGIKVLRTSSLWETEPMYVLDQNSFINGACEVGLISDVVS